MLNSFKILLKDVDVFGCKVKWSPNVELKSFGFPSEAGATYRMLERAPIRSGPDMKSSEVGKVGKKHRYLVSIKSHISNMYIWSRPPAGYPPPPPWYGPGRGTGPGTWHAFTAPSLGYVPSMFAFVPALSRVPCKYHKILHHLQRLRLHQPAFPPIHNHPTHSHRGRGREP